MEFGKTLREAREAKGYTTAQLAEMTHIMSGTIDGLEHEDFSGIAAPIYGRGFVKLCCQALGLDPKPMIEEFMAIYNGEKPAACETSVPAAPTPETKPEPAAAPAPEPIPEPIAAEQSTVEDPFRLEEPAAEPACREKPPVSRFAPPRPQDDVMRDRNFTMPAIPWRLIALILGLIAVVWALVAGCGAIYRSLSRPGAETAKSVGSEASEPTAKSSAVITPPAPRTAKPVKPLYID